METVSPTRTWVTIYQLTQRDIPGDLKIQESQISHSHACLNYTLEVWIRILLDRIFVKLEVSQLQVLVQILFCNETSIYQESQTHTVHGLVWEQLVYGFLLIEASCKPIVLDTSLFPVISSCIFSNVQNITASLSSLCRNSSNVVSIIVLIALLWILLLSVLIFFIN